MLIAQIVPLVEQCIRPKKIIFTHAQQFRYEKCVLPSFDVFCRLITDAYNQFETRLLSTLKTSLTKTQQASLDELIPPAQTKKKPYQRAKLTLLKRLNQAVRPNKINASLDDCALIAHLYTPFEKLIAELSLTDQAVQYYAGWVFKATAAQVKQFPTPMKRYLHLIAFVAHQYRHYQDNFSDIMGKAVQSTLNRMEKKKIQAHYLAASERNTAAQLLFNDRALLRGTLDKIKTTGLSPKLTAKQKVSEILTLVDKAKTPPEDGPLIDRFEAQLTEAKNHDEHFDLLEKSANQLLRKLKGIVLALRFNTTHTPSSLREAIDYYQDKKGRIEEHAPTEFLSATQQKHLHTKDKQWRTSLYKVLLFIAIVDAMKANTLTLSASYRYQHLDHYLSEKEAWEENRAEILVKYGLEKFADIDTLSTSLKQTVNTQYEQVDKHYRTGENPHLRFNPQGEMVLSTPKVEKPNTAKIAELLAPYRYTPVLQVLQNVNSVAPYIGNFEHYSIKHVKSTADTQTLFAGIVAEGCNIGADKIASTSKGVELTALNHALTWRFTLENINAANDTLVELIRTLPLPMIFKHDGGESHSSSDGQKKLVAGDSLNANASFKYYGHGKGVSIYTFIDESCALFYSTVMSSSEREAAYVIDGLLHNDAIKSEIHSTDTHGFTDIIFALCHLLGIAFAPRIAKLKKQLLYSITAKHHLQKKEYAISPKKTIRMGLIKSEWETILRLVTAIKSKRCTASDIVKRLSSYTKANPVYKGLREFGRIIKTQFILTYIDDVKLRQRIQKQLNKIELSNKFSNAVFFDNNQTFYQVTKEDQEIAVGCKRLIQNAIILWNYLILSKLVVEAKTQEERSLLLSIIKNGSIMTWSHINMHGEYNFLFLSSANEPVFDLSSLQHMKVA